MAQRPRRRDILPHDRDHLDHHHAALRRLRRIDHKGLILNVILLMTVCVLPFTTALLARYLDKANGSAVAAAVCALARLNPQGV